MIKKLLYTILKLVLGQLKERFKIAKRAFWFGACVGGAVGAAAGAVLVYLVMQ